MSSSEVSSQRPLRAVLIGLGQIGASYAEDPKTRRFFEFATHAQVLESHPEYEWVGACDLSVEACDFVRQQWPQLKVVTATKSLRSLDPEIAVLATGPKARTEIVQQLPSLRGVLTEKPIGIDAHHARDFVAMCQERRLQVQVNLWRRAEKTMRTLAAGGLAQAVGVPQAAVVLYGRGVRNNGTHLVDACRMLFGEPVYVQATTPPRCANSPGVADDFDVAFSLRFLTGLNVSFLPLEFAHYRENAIEIWGTQGCYAIHQEGLLHCSFARVEHRALSDACEIARDAPVHNAQRVGRSLYDMYSNLAASVKGHESLWSPVDSALRTQEVVEAVIESARCGGSRMEFKPCRTIPRRRAS